MVSFLVKAHIPYFFGYTTELFSFQNNPKNLNPSYNIDPDLWDHLGKIKCNYSKIS